MSGRPKDATADENVKVVHTLVMFDRRRDLRSIASEVGIRFGAVQVTSKICQRFRHYGCHEQSPMI